MKHKWILFSLVATTFLAGCQPTNQKSLKGNALFVSEETSSQSADENGVTIQDELARYSESQRMLLNQVNIFYKNLKGVDTTTDVTSPDSEIKIHQTTQENYDSGKLVGYTSDVTTSSKDQSYAVKYYFDGKETYVQSPYQKWEKTANANSSMVYLYMMRLLLEGKDTITMEEGLEQPILTKTITDPTQVKSLGYFFNLPLNLGANANAQAKIDYQVDKENGRVVNMSATVTAQENGATNTFKVYATTQEVKDRTEVKVDVESEAAKQEVADGKYLELFKKANPFDAIYVYEMTLGMRTPNSDQAWLQVVNTWKAQPYQIAEGEIKDQKADNYRLLYQNKAWKLDGDNVMSEDVTMSDYYRYFVQRFAERFDSLTTVKAGDNAQESTTTTYREQFESDPAGFKAAAGTLDVSNLLTEGRALYAVDYVVNKATLQLEAVYCWRVLPEDTEITTVNTLSFRHLNTVTLSIINGVIGEKVWTNLK